MQSSKDLFVLYPVSCLAEWKFNTSSCSYSSRMPIVLLWSSLLPVGNHSLLSNVSIFIMRMGTCAKSIKKIEFAMSSTGRSRHNLVFFFFSAGWCEWVFSHFTQPWAWKQFEGYSSVGTISSFSYKVILEEKDVKSSGTMAVIM